MLKLIVENIDKENSIQAFSSIEELAKLLTKLNVNTISGSLQFDSCSYIVFNRVEKDSVLDFIGTVDNQVWENEHEKTIQFTKSVQF